MLTRQFLNSAVLLSFLASLHGPILDTFSFCLFLPFLPALLRPAPLHSHLIQVCLGHLILFTTPSLCLSTHKNFKSNPSEVYSDAPRCTICRVPHLHHFIHHSPKSRHSSSSHFKAGGRLREVECPNLLGKDPTQVCLASSIA